MAIPRKNKQANEALRASAGRVPVEREEKPETPGDLPNDIAGVMAVPAEDLELVAGELEVHAADLAKEYANAALLVGAINARLETEGGGEDAEA